MAKAMFQGKNIKGINFSAQDTIYSNVTSGLTSGTVQGAIDELNSNLNNYALKAATTTAKSSDVSYNIAANSNATVNVAIPTKSGYDAAGVLTLYNTNIWVAISGWYVQNGNMVVACHNTSTTSAASGKITLIFLYTRHFS